MKEILEIIIKDKDYPSKLAKIKNPPKKIYAQGNLDLLKNPSIGIVGSRDCTIYGYNEAQEIAEAVSQKGICVVSGLAMRN